MRGGAHAQRPGHRHRRGHAHAGEGAGARRRRRRPAGDRHGQATRRPGEWPG